MNQKIIPLERDKNAVSATKKVGVAYKETIGYDVNGEVVYDNVKRSVRQNGGGFVISYTEKMCDFLARVSTGSVVRVFLYIAHHQNYGNDGIFGFRCTHKFLEQALRLDRKSVYSALATLKDKYLLVETREGGCTEFMVNPQYVTIGQDKKARVREWNLRWERVNKEKATGSKALSSGR